MQLGTFQFVMSSFPSVDYAIHIFKIELIINNINSFGPVCFLNFFFKYYNLKTHWLIYRETVISYFM